MNIIPQCPNCGCTRVQYNYSMSTAMNFIQVVDNGTWEDCDPNYHTTFYTCCKCHHKFHICERYGKIEAAIDDGAEPEISTIKMPINAISSENTISTDTIDIKKSEPQLKFQWQLDIEDLQRQMKEVKEALERLEVNMSNGHSDLVETTQM